MIPSFSGECYLFLLITEKSAGSCRRIFVHMIWNSSSINSLRICLVIGKNFGGCLSLQFDFSVFYQLNENPRQIGIKLLPRLLF